MVFAKVLDLETPRVDCCTGLILNRHGNAITLSRALWEAVRMAGSLRTVLRERREKLVLGVPFLLSSHHFLARAWLESQGLVPEQVAQFVVVPPPQMPGHLKAGHLAGYCVGEPWNSVAVSQRTGCIAATSAEVVAMHPEKVLLVRQEFAAGRAEEHIRMIAAILQACSYCDAAENREEILEILSRREYVNAPIEVLRPSFTGDFSGVEHNIREDFTIFARGDTNEPTEEKAVWVLQAMRAAGLHKGPGGEDRALARRAFRWDIFEQALGLQRATEHTNETNLKNQEAFV
jgi:ABC-type nitrate/sulfonate/bicarbonate transport system substrate-binding protein